MSTEVDASTLKTKSNLTRADWVRAARELLIKNGIGNVRLRRLADALNVTTGAFYWQYGKLEELHEDLLKDWERRNTEPFSKALSAANGDGRRQLLAFYRIVMLEEQYDPAYDNAVRDWSEQSAKVKTSLHAIDTYRIELIRDIFENLGFSGRSAETRARIQYYHQVGYQAMRVKETLEDRLKNAPYYSDILTNNSIGLELGDPDTLYNLLLETPLE